MNPAIQSQVSAVLPGRVIEQLTEQLSALTWLETVYPLAQIGLRNVQLNGNDRPLRYPTVYRNDGKTYQHIISPDRINPIVCIL